MKKAILTLQLLLFFGCTEPSPPTHEEVSNWFDDNVILLEELRSIGVAHPSLRRAEPALKKFTDYYKNPSEEDLVAERRVYEIVEELGVDFVSFSRSSPDFKDLAFLSVPAYRYGLSLGGVSVMIVYVNDPSSIERIIENSHKTSFTKLPFDGWYIEESDSR